MRVINEKRLKELDFPNGICDCIKALEESGVLIDNRLEELFKKLANPPEHKILKDLLKRIKSDKKKYANY